MAHILSLNGNDPVIDPSVWLAHDVNVIGEVSIGKNCSIWFQSILRGDVCSINIGDNVNIQDACMIHGTTNKSKVEIGDNVSIGHRAIIHGAIIEPNVLIGMGAIILDNAIIKSGSVIAAGSVVLENTVVESGCLYGGIPAKKIKDIDQAMADYYIKGTAEAYKHYSSWYK